jgi:NADPH:quinone reductase-like Zn-dependent oxidoreductase
MSGGKSNARGTPQGGVAMTTGSGTLMPGIPRTVNTSVSTWRGRSHSSGLADDLQALMKLIAEGKMRPVIDKVLPLEQAREGLRLIESREVIGKVVVELSS